MNAREYECSRVFNASISLVTNVMRSSVEKRRKIVYSSSTRVLTAYLTGTHIEDARMPGPEPDTKWVGWMPSSHGCCVRSADTAVGGRSEIKIRTKINLARCGVCSNARS